jgi:hypothetical protein
MRIKTKTLKAYISTASIFHSLLKGHDLSPQLENKLMKLMNNDDDIDKKIYNR